MSDTRKDPFVTLFERFPEERVPDAMRSMLMQQVFRRAVAKRKRAERLEWLALSLATLSLLAMSVGVFVYLDISIPQIPTISWPVFRFYAFVGLLVILLLITDYWLRKRYFDQAKEH